MSSAHARPVDNPIKLSKVNCQFPDDVSPCDFEIIL